MLEDIRWKQRFENFEKAFFQFRDAVQKPELSELEENGLIQRFEFTVELAWKTLKDLLEEGGYIIRSPKDAVRQALNAGLLTDGHIWIRAIEVRNRLSHDYSGKYMLKVLPEIRDKLYVAIEQLYNYLKSLPDDK